MFDPVGWDWRFASRGTNICGRLSAPWHRTLLIGRIADFGAWCGEGQLPADSVEKQRVAFAESCALKSARASFLSGFARLLRCRKNLSQFAEVLGGGGEEEFVICTAWAA